MSAPPKHTKTPAKTVLKPVQLETPGVSTTGVSDLLKTLDDLTPGAYSNLLQASMPDDLRSLNLWGGPVDPKTQKLEEEISGLRADMQKQMEVVQREKKNRKEIAKMKVGMAELKRKQGFAFLLSRVTPKSHDALFSNEALRNKFFAADEQNAYVVAIDIRRSTDLMLKAHRPQRFADFMTSLCNELASIIKDHFGVFDKFTGDGILAFFPEFFSGTDAGYHALTAANAARRSFERLYKEHRSSFSTVLTGVQLATGIDYGAVHLVRVADGLTVVGRPVVYACRLSGGLGGQILLNQPAYEHVAARYGSLFFITETNIEIKHEGSILCYAVDPNNAHHTPVAPPWATS